MEQILLAYGLSKETVAAIMMLYKNTKVKVCSLDGNTDYFNIIAGLLQGDTLALYLFIICLNYVSRISIDLMKDNGIKLAKKRNRSYPAQNNTDADYADDIALLANSPAQAESLLDILEQAAVGIGLNINAAQNRMAKTRTAFERLSVIWTLDQTDKIKCSFSNQRSCRYCYMDAPHGC